MKIRMKVEGGNALARKLQMIAEETARKHMKEAMLEAAEVVRQEAIARAPVGPSRVRKTKKGIPIQQGGLLKGDIIKEVWKQTKNKVDIFVGPSQKTGWYAYFVELGHALVSPAETSKAYQARKEAKKESRPFIWRRMVPPHPFLGPALETKHEEATNAASKELKRRLKL